MPRKKTVVAEVRGGDVINTVSEELQAEETPASATGDTVIVCSNYPCDVKFNVPTSTGRMETITIKGNAVNLKGKDKGIIPVGAYGITADIPKEAWEWVVANYPDFEPIKRGLMFASTAATARDEIMERSDLRHGYEPIDPNKANNSEPLK